MTNWNPYYHGTEKERLRSIREHGLSFPFLSSDEEQARCWARARSGRGQGRVLEFEVPDESLVVPDFNLMDPDERYKVLGVHPEEYFDVRDELFPGGAGRDRLLGATLDYGQNWVEDRECGGEASIYLGAVPWENIRVVRPRRNPPWDDRMDDLIELVRLSPKEFSISGLAPGEILSCGGNGCVFKAVGRGARGKVIKVSFDNLEARLAKKLKGPRRQEFLPVFYGGKIVPGPKVGVDPVFQFGVLAREDLADFPMPEHGSYPDAVMYLLADEPDPRAVVDRYLDWLSNLEVQAILAIGGLLAWGQREGLWFDPMEFSWEEDDDRQPGEEEILPNAVTNLGITKDGRVVIRDLGNFEPEPGAL